MERVTRVLVPNSESQRQVIPNPPFILSKGIELVPAIKTFCVATREHKALGRRLRYILNEVRDVDWLSNDGCRRNIVQSSSLIQNAKEPGIRTAQFNAKLHTVAAADI